MASKKQSDDMSDSEEIRQKTVSLIEKYTIKKLTKDFASKIEDGIYNISIGENNSFNTMLYTIYTVKVLENLKNPYAINNLKNGTWKPEDFPSLEKDVLNPEKWQQIQDIRLPKNVKKEKKKGVNKCPRCKSWYTSYTQAQTRSADEGITTFVHCEDCGFRYKFN